MIYNALTEQDKKNILTWVANYAEPEEDNLEYALAPAPTDAAPILAEWDLAKEKLFHLFGDKFIITKNIKYYKSDNDLRQLMYENVVKDNDLRHAMVRKFNTYEPQNRITEMFFEENLISNKCPFDYTFHILGDTTTYTVKKGMKTTRAIVNLAKKLNINHNIIDSFLLAHSMVMNDAKLEGTLCISIHPLDFMTMSDNNNDWSSCMKWRQRGAYRVGTIEMMNSPYVVCAYLKSDTKELTVPDTDFIWNSKKWRELFIVNDDLIMEIKSYPYANENLTKEAHQMIRDLYPAGHFHKSEEIYPYVNHEYAWGECAFDFYTDMMYNDIYENDLTAYWGCVSTTIDTNYHINYSGVAICAYCGKPLTESQHEEVLLCEDCRKPNVIGHCAKCGCDITTMNLGIQIGGKMFCGKETCRPEIRYESFIDITKNEIDDLAAYWSPTRLLREDCEPVYLARKKDNPQLTDTYSYTEKSRLFLDHNTFPIGYLPHYKNNKWYYNMDDITEFRHLCSWGLSAACASRSSYLPYTHFTGGNANMPFNLENMLKLYSEGKLERFMECYDIDVLAYLAANKDFI